MDTQFFLELEQPPLLDGSSDGDRRREDSVMLGTAPGDGRNASSISTSTSPQHFYPSTQPQLVQTQPQHFKQPIPPVQSSPHSFLSSPQRRKTDRSRTTPPNSMRPSVAATPESPSMLTSPHNGSTTPYEKDNFRACSIPAPSAMPWINSLPSRSREVGDHLPGHSTAVSSSLKPESYHQLKMKYLRSLNINMPDNRHQPQRMGRDRGVSMPPAVGATSSSHTMPMPVPIKHVDLEDAKLGGPPPTLPVGTVVDAPFVPPHELVNHTDSFSLYHYNQRKQGAKHAV